jgi:hypothetical protein
MRLRQFLLNTTSLSVMLISQHLPFNGLLRLYLRLILMPTSLTSLELERLGVFYGPSTILEAGTWFGKYWSSAQSRQWKGHGLKN